MPPYAPLRMIAEDQEDLTLISACLQDALIPLSGLEYDQESGHFRLIANRFCWECDAELQEEKSYYTRVPAGLAFHHVKEVHKLGLNLQNKNELVNLLTIQTTDEDDYIHLIFSGGGEIKLHIDKLLCHLKDIDEPYPTANKPDHGA